MIDTAEIYIINEKLMCAMLLSLERSTFGPKGFGNTFLFIVLAFASVLDNGFHIVLSPFGEFNYYGHQ